MHNPIRRYTPNDSEALKAFVRKNYHERYILTDERFLFWQYRNADGALNLLVADHNGVRGMLGCIPVSLSLKGAAVRALCLANIMVEPAFRGKGLGALFIQEAMKNAPIVYTAGYNDAMASLYRSLRWRQTMLERWVRVFDAAAVGALIDPLRPPTLPPAKAPASPPEGWQYETTREVPSDAEMLWNAVALKYPVTITRTFSYLRWRFAEHPVFSYTFILIRRKSLLEGVAVVRMDGAETWNVARIVDLYATKEAEEPLLAKTLHWCEAQGAHCADYFTTKGFHTEALEDTGCLEIGTSPLLAKIPWLLSPIDRTLSRPSINLAYYAIPEMEDWVRDETQWYVTKADGDQDRPNPSRV